MRRIGDYDVSDCAILPAGDLLLLERSFSRLRGVGMRIRRVPLGEVKVGAVVDGPVLVEVDMGYQIDNMEGLSVHRAAERRRGAHADLGRQFLRSAADAAAAVHAHGALKQNARRVERGDPEIPSSVRGRSGRLRRGSLLLDLALELERLGRQIVGARLLEEAVQPAAMVDGLERVRRDLSFTERPSASDIRVTLNRFGRKRRLVLMFEWLTLWPTRGPLPVRSQRRDMALNPCVPGGAAVRSRASKPGVGRKSRTYNDRGRRRQAALWSGSRHHRFDVFPADHNR